MHVKDIAFNAFASFALPAKLEDADPHVNVVIGRNGAGKSNVFLALRYVLSGLGDRDPRSFVFRAGSEEGRGAFAEVVVDDTEHELALNASKVRLGRATTRHGTHFADRYKINGRKAMRDTIRARLALAGLGTPAEQLFIVPQGESTRLASATNAERLQALLALCGADAYDRSVTSVEQLLTTSERKLARMETQLGGMDQRLEIVQRELEFLRAWLADQAELRGIALVLYNIEMRRTDTRLATDRDAHAELEHSARTAQDEADSADAALASAHDAVADADANIERAQLDVSYAHGQLEAQKAHKRRLESANTETTSRNNAIRTSRAAAAASGTTPGVNTLEQLRRTWQARSESAAAWRKRLSIERAADEYARVMRSKDVKAEIAALEQRLVELRSRIGEISQQRSLSAECSGSQDTQERVMNLLVAQVKTSQAAAMAAQRAENTAQSKLTSAEDALRSARVEVRGQELAEQRLERAENTAQAALMQRDLPQLVRGVSGVRAAAHTTGTSENYFGTVAELIEVAPAAQLAVERIAGTSLYDHVVDSSQTAKTLAAELGAARGSLGGATFVPLRDLTVQAHSDDSLVNDSDCSPLRNEVTVPAKYQQVADMLFGRVWLCPDLEAAQRLARHKRVIGVTVDGDVCRPGGTVQVSGNNTFVGHESRLTLVRKLAQIAKDRVAASEAARAAREHAENAAQGVTAARNALAGAQRANKDASTNASAARNDLLELQSSSTRALERSVNADRVAHALETELAAAEVAIKALRQSGKTGRAYDFSSELANSAPGALEGGDASEQQGSSLSASVAAEQAAYEAEVAFRKASAARALTQAEAEEEVEENPADSDDEMEDGNGSDADEAEHPTISQVLRQAVSNIQARQADVQARKRDLKRAEEAAEKAREAETRAASRSSAAHVALRAVQAKLSTSGMKVGALEKFRAGLFERCRKLRNVPEDFTNTAEEVITESRSPEELRSLAKEMEQRAADARRRLAERGRINMAAAHAYERYAGEATALRERHNALLEDHTRIVEIRSRAGAIRQERVTGFLEQLVNEFPRMLSRLGNGAAGFLDIQRDGDEITGVGFDRIFADTHMRLSGGQKTITSLALMFAAHAVRRVPFFVLDEVDSNLDSGMRAAVAKTVAELSREMDTQFFCTTFSEELVQNADATWAVTFDHEHSEITRVEPSLALDVVRAGGAEELPPALREARDRRRETEPWDDPAEPNVSASARRGDKDAGAANAMASSHDSQVSWRELEQVRLGHIGDLETSDESSDAEEESNNEASEQVSDDGEEEEEEEELASSPNRGATKRRTDATEQTTSPPKSQRTARSNTGPRAGRRH